VPWRGLCSALTLAFGFLYCFAACLAPAGELPRTITGACAGGKGGAAAETAAADAGGSAGKGGGGGGGAGGAGGAAATPAVVVRKPTNPFSFGAPVQAAEEEDGGR
jgi:hypothetical protein